MKGVLTALFITTAISGFSQNVITFRQAEKLGVRVAELDSIYPSALHSDSAKAVFPNREQEFTRAYKQTLQELGNFLKQHKFSWGKETKSFNRIYFSKNGQIDYFLYNFKEGEITAEKEKQFSLLLMQFIKDYKFPLEAETGFSQCSPVRYND